MENGEKFPKEIIERFDVFEKEFLIEEFNVSAFQDSWYGGDNGIKIVGEIIGGQLSDDIIIIGSVYNSEGEIIGTSFRERIDSDGFEGIDTFSFNVHVASNEEIAKIRVYPVRNPATIW